MQVTENVYYYVTSVALRDAIRIIAQIRQITYSVIMHQWVHSNNTDRSDFLNREITFIFFPLRIVRNKAAERAKVNYNGGNGGGTGAGSPGSSGSGGGGGGGNGSSGAGPVSSTPSSVQQQQSNSICHNSVSAAVAAAAAAESILQRPSYSINGILGIPQPDANANNINKRKRDDEGESDNRAVLIIAQCSAL